MKTQGKKQATNLNISLLLHLLSNNHCLEDFKKKLHICSTFCIKLSPFNESHLVKDAPCLLFSFSLPSFFFCVFFLEVNFFSLLQQTAKVIFAFKNTTADLYVASIKIGPFNIDWLANFWKWTNLIGLIQSG